ncbi:MAG: ArnT family glycosyltransferase [Solirubrobacteraceae bacterium]
MTRTLRFTKPTVAHGVLAVTVLALVVRLIVVAATPAFVPETDSADYDRIAVSLVQTGSLPVSGLAARPGGPTAFRPPVFPVLLAGVYGVVGVGSGKVRWEAGRVLEAVLGAVAVWLVCLIALRLWGPVVAVVAGALAAVYPPLLLVGSSLMTEPLFIALVLGSVLAALVGRESGRLRWSVLGGGLVGLAALTRGNGIVVVVAVAGLVWRSRPWWARRSLMAPAVVVLATAVTIIPWAIRNAQVFHGRFVPVSTETGYALAGTYDTFAQSRSDFPALWAWPFAEMHRIYAQHPAASEAEISSRLGTEAVKYVEHHPVALVRTAFWNTLRLLNLTGTRLERIAAAGEAYPPTLSEISVYAFWILGLLAIAGTFTAAARRAPTGFWLAPVLLFLSSLFLIGTTRYRSPVDPFLIMLAALPLAARLRART